MIPKFFPRCLVITSAAAFVIQAPSCKARRTPEKSNLRFAISPLGDSILPEIERSGGKLAVCVALIGFDDSERQTAERWHREHVADAVNAWNSLLKDHPEWPIQRKIETNFTFVEKKCDPYAAGLKINLWHNKEDFIRENCTNPNWVCASHADTPNRAIILGTYNRGLESELYDHRRLVHEYGHILGLGDTYRNKGMSDWLEDQPPSVMNGETFPPGTFSSDDKWGLWATLHAVKTNRRDCNGYGKVVEMKQNTWNNLMCDPRTETNYVHRLITDLPEMPSSGSPKRNDSEELTAPLQAGKWAYEGYDVKDYYMIIKADDRERNSFRAVGVLNGLISSETGTLYRCDQPSTSQFPRECVATSSNEYRITLKSRTSLVLRTPARPQGVSATLYAPATIDWAL